MTRVLLGVCVLFSVASIANAAGDWWGHLEGDIGVGQMPLVDPAPTDPPAAYFVIKGDAAKRMYEKMGGEVVARQDSCEEGVVTKFSGDLQCAVHVNDQIADGEQWLKDFYQQRTQMYPAEAKRYQLELESLLKQYREEQKTKSK
jgi:hypothetical protein